MQITILIFFFHMHFLSLLYALGAPYENTNINRLFQHSHLFLQNKLAEQIGNIHIHPFALFSFIPLNMFHLLQFKQDSNPSLLYSYCKLSIERIFLLSLNSYLYFLLAICHFIYVYLKPISSYMHSSRHNNMIQSNRSHVPICLDLSIFRDILNLIFQSFIICFYTCISL